MAPAFSGSSSSQDFEFLKMGTPPPQNKAKSQIC